MRVTLGCSEFCVSITLVVLKAREEITPRKAVALALSIQLGLHRTVWVATASGLLMIFQAVFLRQPKP